MVVEYPAQFPHVFQNHLFEALDRSLIERLRGHASLERVLRLVDRRQRGGHLEEMPKGAVHLGLLGVCGGAVDGGECRVCVYGYAVGTEADDWSCNVKVKKTNSASANV